MSILKIARMGHPVLRKAAKAVDPKIITTPEIKGLVRDMFETMVEHNGVGLAAPQVHMSMQLALVGGEEDDEGRPLIRVVFNPEITPTTDEVFGMYEGCLSIPGMRGYVERPAAVHVAYHDADGRRAELDLEGFPAVVMQHECDHLAGVLYIDRIEDLSKFAYEEEADRFLPVNDFIGDDDDYDPEDDSDE